MKENLIRFPHEKRSEPRREAGLFHSVEINLGPPLPIYQFALKDISSKGMCIIVRDGSPILKHLREGQMLELKCYSRDEFKSNITKSLRAEIRHITNGEPWHYKGSFLVGLLILDKA